MLNHYERTIIAETAPMSGTSTVHFDMDGFHGYRGLPLEWETVSEPGAAIEVKTPRKTHNAIVRHVQCILEELRIPHSKVSVEDEDCTIFSGSRGACYREIEVEYGEVTAMVEGPDGTFSHFECPTRSDEAIRELAKKAFPPESPRTTLRRFELPPATPWYVWLSLALAFILIMAWLCSSSH